MLWDVLEAWAPIVISVVALGLSAWGLKHTRDSADAAKRSAAAAERQATAAEAGLPPDVAWRLEPQNAAFYLLRNVGTKIAEDVKIGPEGGSIRSGSPAWVAPNAALIVQVKQPNGPRAVAHLAVQLEGTGRLGYGARSSQVTPGAPAHRH